MRNSSSSIDRRTRSHHDRIISAAAVELRGEDLVAWEIEELTATVRMFSAALADVPAVAPA